MMITAQWRGQLLFNVQTLDDSYASHECCLTHSVMSYETTMNEQNDTILLNLVSFPLKQCFTLQSDLS